MALDFGDFAGRREILRGSMQSGDGGHLLLCLFFFGLSPLAPLCIWVLAVEDGRLSFSSARERGGGVVGFDQWSIESMRVTYSDASVLCLYASGTMYKMLFRTNSSRDRIPTYISRYEKNVNMEHGIKPPRPAPTHGPIRIIRTSTITKISRALACLYENAITFLISAIALPGLNPFGHVREQLRMVWQR